VTLSKSAAVSAGCAVSTASFKISCLVEGKKLVRIRMDLRLFHATPVLNRTKDFIQNKTVGGPVLGWVCSTHSVYQIILLSAKIGFLTQDKHR